jgi:hypothetical protein
MERIVIRPARASDAADLARNWIEGAQHHVELDPESFRVPSTDGLVEFFEESLGMTAWTESTSLRIWRLGFRIPRGAHNASGQRPGAVRFACLLIILAPSGE